MVSYEKNKKHIQKYLKSVDEIKVRVPKGKKAEYQKRAETAGKSLNQFIVDCIEKGEG